MWHSRSRPLISSTDASSPEMSEGKRTSKPERSSIRHEFLAELENSNKCGPGRSGDKSLGPVRRRERGSSELPLLASKSMQGKSMQQLCAGAAPVEPSTPAVEPPTSFAGHATPSSSVSMRMAKLQKEIAEAVALENYASAAALKQDLDMARKAHMRHSELKQAVQTAVAQEDYATAAKLQAELKSLGEGCSGSGGSSAREARCVDGADPSDGVEEAKPSLAAGVSLAC